MTFVDMAGLIARDRLLKPGGQLFDDESINLTAIYRGQARELTRTWLRAMGQGDPDNRKPLQTKLLQRLVKTAAITWANAPTRRLLLDDVPLPDLSPEARLLERFYRPINSVLKQADRWRTGLGQAAIYFSPDDRRGRPKARIYQPHNVARDPDDSDADDIGSDARLAFKVAHVDGRPEACIWHYWAQEDDGWHAWRVYESGELVTDEDALYPGGVVPWRVAPFVMLYDEDPEGHAWVPIDETRSAFSLGLNVSLNEIAYLLKQEAHSPVYASGVANSQDLPKRWGPGAFWGFEEAEARVQSLGLNPKLLESIQISRHLLEIFAGGEGLPADYFLASRRYETGAAGQLRQQDLEARRQDQQQQAIETEERIFEIVREMAAASSTRWNVRPLPVDAEIEVELGRPFQSIDLGELQQTYAFDLSIGAASLVGYLQERHRLTRDQAIRRLARVEVERALYPLRENPASLIGGPRPAAGQGSATPAGSPSDVQPDASSMNPNRAASVDGASNVAAARRGIAR